MIDFGMPPLHFYYSKTIKAYVSEELKCIFFLCFRPANLFVIHLIDVPMRRTKKVEWQGIQAFDKAINY